MADAFLPYGTQWIDEEDVAAVADCLRSSHLTQGPRVPEFEAALRRATGAAHAVAVSSGTAALHLSALALLSPGERAITTPNSFVATSNAILLAGARPVFVDIQGDGGIDLDLAEWELERDPTIRALFPVDFGGRMTDPDRLARLRAKFGVIVVEDCAHSLGATCAGSGGATVRAGACRDADAAILSFHPVKHVTTGEGGAILTNDEAIARRARLLRSHGIERSTFADGGRAFDEAGEANPWYYEMNELGFHYRMSDLQAALGLSQLRKLDRFLAKRRALAARYVERLAGHPLVSPLHPFDPGAAYHLFVVRIDFARAGVRRGALMRELSARGIGSQVHYLPIHRQPYYRSLGHGGEATPAMDRYYEECLSLPLFPKMEAEDADRVVAELSSLLGE